MDEQIYVVLNSIQSPDQAVRTGAESRLGSILNDPDSGIALCRIALNHQLPSPTRQLSAVILRKYITQYWSAIFPQFTGPMLPSSQKEIIRELLLGALGEQDSKIRTAMAHALSSIASSDWPEDFPTLVPRLLGILEQATSGSEGGNEQATQGAMRVLYEFVRSDLMEEQLLTLLRSSMPVLLALLSSPSTALRSAQSYAVRIFRTALKTLYMMKEEQGGIVAQAMEGVVPGWIEGMGGVLMRDISGEIRQGGWEGIDLRNEIFKTLATLQSSFPRVLQPHLSSFLHLSLTHLHSLYPMFHSHYLSTSPSAPNPPESKDEQDQAGIVDLGSAIMDFLTGASRARAARVVLCTKDDQGREQAGELMSGLIFEVIGWSQITRDDAEVWENDPNAFVADEDDEAEAYSLRTAAFDLLGSLLDKFESTVPAVLQAASRSRMEESDRLRRAGETDWWKPLEAALACVGSVADALLDGDDEDNGELVKSFDLDQLFKEVVPTLLNSSETPFLQGRAFVFASQFVLTLAEAGISRQYLDAAVQALEADGVQGVVKISAIKTIRNFCRYIKPEELHPLSLRIISDLGPYLSQATEETLALVVETIRAVIGVDGSVLNRDSTEQLTNAILQVWSANTVDIVVLSIIEEVFQTLASSEVQEVYDSLVHTATPIIANILSAPESAENMTLTMSAVELLNAILSGRKGDIGETIGPNVWPAVFHTMLTTDDSDTIQYGCQTLTSFVRKVGPQLFAWQDASGRSGLDSILAVLARLIDPACSESAGLCVGDLILHLLRNAGQHLSATIPNLLNALANRIAGAKSTIFTQTLCLPFAYLLTVEMDLTLDLLEKLVIQVPNGPEKTGLQVVLTAWCDDAIDTVQGSYSIRVNDMAMSNLLTCERPSLRAIVVKGDMVVDEVNRNTIMTRSRTANNPHTFVPIPFHLRALKYLLAQVQTAETAELENAEDAEGIDQDDGDEEWEEEDDLTKGEKEEMGWLSDMLGGGGKWNELEDDLDGQEADEDLMADQLMQLNMPAHITGAVRHAYVKNINTVQDLVNGLTDIEKAVMGRKVLTM